MFISPRLAGFMLAALLCGDASSAGVYRWVDEQGRTHFGDRPPPTGDAQEMQLPRSPASSTGDASFTEDRARARRKLLEYFDDKRAEEKAAAERAERERAARAAGCRDARQALQRYSSAGRIFRPTADGGRAYLSAEDRDALIERLEAQIAQLCE
jgi:hypothetical protein